MPSIPNAPISARLTRLESPENDATLHPTEPPIRSSPAYRGREHKVSSWRVGSDEVMEQTDAPSGAPIRLRPAVPHGSSAVRYKCRTGAPADPRMRVPAHATFPQVQP